MLDQETRSEKHPKKRFNKVVILVPLVLVMGYFLFKQVAVASCNTKARDAANKYNNRSGIDNTEAGLFYETKFNICIRDKGFLN